MDHNHPKAHQEDLEDSSTHVHSAEKDGSEKRCVLTVRSHSGLSGDMLVAGLLSMTKLDQEELDQILSGILPALTGSVRLVRREISHITGWHAEVNLPHEHSHRTCADIIEIIDKSGLSERGRILARDTFTLLASVEAEVHGIESSAVHFHEVGALDSILDICLSSELFARLAPDLFVVSPLPLADGSVHCAHGILPTPAPAVLSLLPELAVRPFAGEGETVTPTAAALLHSFTASFGPWPEMQVERTALVYGTKVFPGLPNGASFALGRSLSRLSCSSARS